MKKYNYDISVRELVPLIGRVFYYYATAMVYEDKGDRGERVAHDFGEVHGKTKEDADQKMTARIQKWIANNEK